MAVKCHTHFQDICRSRLIYIYAILFSILLLLFFFWPGQTFAWQYHKKMGAIVQTYFQKIKRKHLCSSLHEVAPFTRSLTTYTYTGWHLNLLSSSMAGNKYQRLFVATSAAFSYNYIGYSHLGGGFFFCHSLKLSPLTLAAVNSNSETWCLSSTEQRWIQELERVGTHRDFTGGNWFKNSLPWQQ